jgi:uncharacterized membrane protein
MKSGLNQLRFILNRLRERLWVRPLAICLVSITGAFVAKITDDTSLKKFSPDVSIESLETLLSTLAASMLVVATFAVGSMVAAYASTSNTATPRSFPLVIADDVSQNALSTFIGAFIFSIVALIAVQNDFYQTTGRFTLFLLTITVFALVVGTFVRWVDRIARLGRLGTTINTVEAATAAAIRRRQAAPNLGGGCAQIPLSGGKPLFGLQVGYVQHVDVEALQVFAQEADCRVVVAALPGTFATPDRPLAYIIGSGNSEKEAQVAKAFTIGGDRVLENDPRFGFVMLSEIAGRALSPAVNDPGTAIDIVGTTVRLFCLWLNVAGTGAAQAPTCDRVDVPSLSVHDMFDDAFTAIARDGAGTIEVAIRLQKAFVSLASLGDTAVRDAAIHHARTAMTRSEKALGLPEEIASVRELAVCAMSRE